MTSDTRETARSSDESVVRALYQQLLASWNAWNATGFAAPFTDDADVIGFDGSQMTGRAEIEATLRQIFADHETGAYVGIVRKCTPPDAGGGPAARRLRRHSRWSI